MKRLFLTLITLLAIGSYANAKELTPSEIMKGAVRITAKRDGRTYYGSGTIVKHIDKKYFILTNGHVSNESGQTVEIEFFSGDGVFSNPITGKVEWRIYTIDSSQDMAIISVPDSIFKGTYRPTVIPISSRKSTKLSYAQLIYGAGCPSGKWMQFWYCRLLQHKDNIYKFNMPPEGGQSGSGILTSETDDKGEKWTKLVGVVTWRIGNDPHNSYGMGIAINRIYELLTGGSSKDNIKDYISSKEVVKEISTKCSTCNKHKNEHLIITNGKTPYKSNGSIVLYCPTKDNLNIVNNKASSLGKDYRVVQFGNCPDGKCFPWNKKENQTLPPIIPPDNGNNNNNNNNNKELIEFLKRKIQELEAKIKTYEDSTGNYKGEIKSLNELLDRVKNEKTLLEKLNGDLANKSNKLSQENENLNKNNDNLKKNNFDIIKTNDELKEENSTLTKKLEEFLNRFDIPKFGPLGTFLAAIISMIMSGAVGATVWHKFVYPMLVNRFGYIPTKILSRIGGRRLRKRFPELYDKLFVGNSEKKNKLVDESEEKEYNNIVDDILSPTITSTVDKTDSKTNKEPDTSEVIKSENMGESVTIGDVKLNSENNFIQIGKLDDLKSNYPIDLFKQGGDVLEKIHVNEWAVRAGLYKQAVDKLKAGEFKAESGAPLLGQETTAEAIEDWVHEQFYKEARITEYDNEKLVYYNGLLGWLYYTAVKLLRNGELQVLGYKETADAIDKWVKKEFYSRIIK